MLNPSRLAILALVLSGASLVYAYRNRPEAPLAPKPTEPDAEREAMFDEERLDEHDERLVALERRMLKLELQLMQGGGTPAGPIAGNEELAALRADVDVLLAGEAQTPEAARTRLKETLKSVQSEIFAERLHERQIQRAKAVASAFERFAGEARLDAQQKLELKRVLDGEQEQIRAMMEARPDEGNGGWRGVRRNIRTLRGQTDAAAKALLRPEQAEAYEAMRRASRRGDGPGGFGPPGGFGGRP